MTSTGTGEEKDWERRERSVGGDKRESDLATLIGFEEPGLGEAIVVASHGHAWLGAILTIVSTLSQQGRLLWRRRSSLSLTQIRNLIRAH